MTTDLRCTSTFINIVELFREADFSNISEVFKMFLAIVTVFLAEDFKELSITEEFSFAHTQ